MSRGRLAPVRSFQPILSNFEMASFQRKRSLTFVVAKRARRLQTTSSGRMTCVIDRSLTITLSLILSLRAAHLGFVEANGRTHRRCQGRRRSCSTSSELAGVYSPVTVLIPSEVKIAIYASLIFNVALCVIQSGSMSMSSFLQHFITTIIFSVCRHILLVTLSPRDWNRFGI